MKKKRNYVTVLIFTLLLCGCGKSTIKETGDNSAGIENPVTQETTVQENQAEESTEPDSEVVQEVMAEPEPQELSLIMVGDVLLHDRVEESAQQEDGSYDFTALFSNTGEMISAADLAIVNQEVIIGGEGLGISGYPAFNAPYAIGDALAAAGFDIICHGTNHALDKGKTGLLNCIQFWRTNYPQIGILGIHDSQEDRDSLYIYEKNGIRVAVLNYTYGTNGISLPAGMPYAVDLLEEEQVVEDIRRAEEVADFTIVCPHWGTEYELTPSEEQEAWTEIFLREGVDLVLGTHPHVIEPVEWVIDEETGHKMLVYYSIGNYVNWTSGMGNGVSERMVGGMAEVILTKQEAETENSVEITDYHVTALVSHVQSGRNQVTVYPLAGYSQEIADRNEITEQDSSFSYEYCVNLCNRVWGNLWR